MALKMGNTPITGIEIAKSNISLEDSINNYTTVQKKAGNDISRGDLVSLNDDMWYATPPTNHKPYTTGYTPAVAWWLDEPSQGGINTVFVSFVGATNTQTKTTWYTVSNNSIKYSNVHTITNQGHGNPILLKIAPKKLFLEGHFNKTNPIQYRISSWIYDWTSGSLVTKNNYITSFTTMNSMLRSWPVVLNENFIIDFYKYRTSTTTPYNIYAKILSITDQTLTAVSTTTIDSIDSSAEDYSNYIIMACLLDEEHIFLNTGRKIKIVNIENNIPSISNYSYSTNDNINTMVKINSNSILINDKLEDNYSICQISWSNADETITRTKTLWTSPYEIISFEKGNSTIGVLTDRNLILYFTLLDLNGAEIQTIKLSDNFIGGNAKLTWFNENTYVCASVANKAANPEILKVFLINYDGIKLNYKNDFIETSSMDSFYGIAAENGNEGDNINIYIPQTDN